MQTKPVRYDSLDPLRRVEFDATPVLQWKVTWPDGSSEVIAGHTMQLDENIARFIWHYIGTHRVINLALVRDIAELSAKQD